MRKFAKISAVLAAMVFALAFAGYKSDDDDDDVSGSTLGVGGTVYWISVEEEKDEDGVKYAKSYFEFTSDTTAKCYRYFDQDDVDDGEAPSVGYFVDSYVTFKTNGNVLTATDAKFYYYEKGVWACGKIEGMVDKGTPWSLTYTISGSEMTEVFKCTMKGETGTDTTKYTKVAEKPTAPYKK